jgi:ketosteroid isomerase-like protein
MVARAGFVAAACGVAAPGTGMVAALAVTLGAGCGAPAREARAARARAYDADYSVVYNQVVAAVAAAYPDFLAEDAVQGVIRTPWFPVGLAAEPGASAGASRRSGEHAPPRRFYVRFDISVTGPRPWRVRVAGEASAWELGQPTPEPLAGPEEPPWLQGRIDALQVAIHRRLARHAVPAEPAPAPARDPAPGPTPDADPAAEPVPAHLADVPAGAARAALAIEAAAEARDLDALAGLLHDDVTWSPGAPPDARTALGVWRADPDVLAHLAAAIAAGCRAAPQGHHAGDRAGPPAARRVVCPPGAVAPGFAGYRAELAPAAGGLWKLAAFFTR